VAVKKGEGTHEVVFSRVTIPRWGENISGWMTRTQEPPAAALLVSPSAWGITGFIEAFCHRITRQGFACLAVEPYSRGGKPRRSVPIDQARPDYLQLPREQLRLDLIAGLEFLRKSGYADADRIGGLGLGLGGQALLDLAADRAMGLKGITLMWTPLADPETAGAALSGPVLGLFGGKDEIAPPDSAREFAAAAAKAGAKPELLIYPEAAHAFADDERDTFDEASAGDAWTRLLQFLGRTLS
jgi:carboxymethylenebutenolidase